MGPPQNLRRQASGDVSPYSSGVISNRGPSTPPFTRFAVAAGVVIWAALVACLGAACGSNAQTTAADASTNHSETALGSKSAGGIGVRTRAAFVTSRCDLFSAVVAK
jgi:hypothetical protein